MVLLPEFVYLVRIKMNVMGAAINRKHSKYGIFIHPWQHSFNNYARKQPFQLKKTP